MIKIIYLMILLISEALGFEQQKKKTPARLGKNTHSKNKTNMEITIRKDRLQLLIVILLGLLIFGLIFLFVPGTDSGFVRNALNNV